MLACPSCPAPQAGAPFIQIDRRVASWATDSLSGAGLRAWLRLLTHFRNDRPIPQITERRLAEITGLSAGAAHKALIELRRVLVFAEDDPEEPVEAAPPGRQDGCSRNEQDAHGMSMGCSRNEQSCSRNEQKRSRNEQDTYSIQEKEQELEKKNPPPTSSTKPAGPGAVAADEEEDRFSGTHVPQGGTANSHPGKPHDQPCGAEPTLGKPHQGDAPQLDARLQPVAEELQAYWAGKRGARTTLAFASQQDQLLRILHSPIGGIEAVREQLSVAAMKDWDFIRYQTWHDWRQKHPPALLLEESDLNDGALFPGLKAFERRYRATYGQNSSSADVLVAFRNYTARQERERSLSDLGSA